MNEIRFIDLFSGIGGFRLGLEKAGGFNCVWSNDFNKYANQVYINQFGKDNHSTDDIRKVKPEDIPDHDLFCAGFPCQAFSHAGDRLGFKDPRGTLFFEIVRIARAKRPYLLLLENVRGLINHDRGQTYQTILWELGRLGYWCEWQVLNTKWVGLPQNRERVFIIGHLGGQPKRTIFPIRETGPMDYEEFKRSQEPLFNCIDANFHKGPDKHGQRTIVAIGHTHGHRSGEPRVFYPQDFLRTIVAQGFNQRSMLYYLKDHRLRSPTPLECERAQGFPDGWTKGLSKTQRYRRIGNSVTVDVIEFLGHRIKESLNVLP